MLTQNKFTSIVPRWYPIRRIKYPACYRLKGKKMEKNKKGMPKGMPKGFFANNVAFSPSPAQKHPCWKQKKVM